MTLFPVFFDLAGRKVLVVGGGPVAERKIKLLLSSGAMVTVVAPALTHGLQAQAQRGQITHVRDSFTPVHLGEAWLVIAATNDRVVNQAVSQAAVQRCLPCNVVDDALLSSIQVPAIVDRSPLIVAVSSAGTAPVLARRVRETLEAHLDESLGQMAQLAARYRARIVQRFANLGMRRHFYDWLLDSPLKQLLATGQHAQAETLLLSALDHAEPPARTGHVSLLAGADGAADLLTLRALRALNQADVIVHGPSTHHAILDKARRDAVCLTMAADIHADPDALQVLWLPPVCQHAQAGNRVTVLLAAADASAGDIIIGALEARGVSCRWL